MIGDKSRAHVAEGCALCSRPLEDVAPRPRVATLRPCWAAAFAAMLASCGADDKTAVSYTAYNETDRSIISIIINGEGGILHAPAHDGGGEMCCVVIPNRWKPGLKATIKWQESGDFQRDEHGEIVRIDGVPIVIERPYKETTVEIPKYDERLGRFNVHFLPGGEVRAVVNLYGPRHPDYPLRGIIKPLTASASATAP